MQACCPSFLSWEDPLSLRPVEGGTIFPQVPTGGCIRDKLPSPSTATDLPARLGLCESWVSCHGAPLKPASCRASLLLHRGPGPPKSTPSMLTSKGAEGASPPSGTRMQTFVQCILSTKLSHPSSGRDQGLQLLVCPGRCKNNYFFFQISQRAKLISEESRNQIFIETTA